MSDISENLTHYLGADPQPFRQNWIVYFVTNQLDWSVKYYIYPCEPEHFSELSAQVAAGKLLTVDPHTRWDIVDFRDGIAAKYLQVAGTYKHFGDAETARAAAVRRLYETPKHAYDVWEKTTPLAIYCGICRAGIPCGEYEKHNVYDAGHTSEFARAGGIVLDPPGPSEGALIPKSPKYAYINRSVAGRYRYVFVRAK